ncbi:HAD family hydrolase [Alicyclobacillus dauci]|uniref:HAD family hydrolase n=1 Tax=Alicyclobacillus dauci TaxID=1475485 RepID=A0ABY6Z1U8_9BACL|nr:HAD family hydrolase [Alicyclobacillus dauci]WAH36568.1 HAD family hydrolase [Alicyclobacillus dauci]
MINTLLFDLDGTLLPFDVHPFMQGYFERLVPTLVDHYEPTAVTAWILDATQKVVENESPQLTNMEKFRRALFGGNVDDESRVWPIFEQFYRTTFEELRHLTHPTKIAREICRTATAKGYRVVLATNPIFPDIATNARMRWAEIDDVAFELVTTMENSHFCKPNPKYYLEVAEKVGAAPSECMMFGNDVQEDGAAGYVGMHTFLVTDYVIDRNLGTFDFDQQGTLSEVLDYVKSLPTVSI